MEYVDIWKLIQEGDFELACNEADKQYNVTKDILVLRNKVYALLFLKKYNEVIALSHKIIALRNGETSTDFLFCGIAYWLIGDFENAINIWTKARKCKYKDVGGGVDIEVILYFASIKTNNFKLKDAVLGKLRLLLSKHKHQSWPIPLSMYLLEEIENKELLSSVSTISILKERQLCQSYFVIGLKYLEKNDNTNYLEMLQKIVSLGSNSYLEEMYFFTMEGGNGNGSDLLSQK